VPVTGAIAVMGSVSMSIITVVVAGTITLIMIAGMMVLDFGIRKALKDGFWLGIVLRLGDRNMEKRPFATNLLPLSHS
jgi:hypothetical protein